MPEVEAKIRSRNSSTTSDPRIGILPICHCMRRPLSINIKQLIYAQHGQPSAVLSIRERQTNWDQSIGHNQVLVEWKAAPINPADINQIQGVYPIRPPLPAVGGNEGSGTVLKVGSRVGTHKPGDSVIASTAGLGTWCSHGLYEQEQLFPLPPSYLHSLPVASAMLQVNPPTAFRMLSDFVRLEKGDWVAQNGANSAVGRYVIQICRIRGLKSLNIVRNRPEIDELREELTALGADQVHTEEEFAQLLRSPTLPKAKLALNCVGGRSSLQLARALDQAGCLVSYGGMSQQPVQVSTASLIFDDIRLHGFWMSRWYEQQQRQGRTEERLEMYQQIGVWHSTGDLQMPPHRTWPLEQFGEAIQQATGQKEGGEGGGRRRQKHVFVM